MICLDCIKKDAKKLGNDDFNLLYRIKSYTSLQNSTTIDILMRHRFNRMKIDRLRNTLNKLFLLGFIEKVKDGNPCYYYITEAGLEALKYDINRK